MNGWKGVKILNFQVKKYVVEETSTIRDALTKIQENAYGMICISSVSASTKGEIIGMATDGDIRRNLLAGTTLDDSISICLNREFVWASVHERRVNLLKKLDSHIKYIPILDDKKKLTFIVSRDFLPLQEEQEVYIRARAPVRVSFGGGGSDLTHYFVENGGAVVNAAVSIYSHATMKMSQDSSISIHSLDLGETLTANNLDEALSQEGSFGLVLALLKVIKPKFGFELYLHSDFPLGSGLGGSATVSAVVLGCFNMLRADRWDRHELAEIAFQAERLHLGIAGGWQDQYAAVFGGVNFLEFGPNDNIVQPIRIHQDTLLELEESLILCDTTIAHHSGDIHVDQKETMNSASIRKKVKENVSLTYEIRNYLLSGKLNNFGSTLNKGWQLKKSFSKMISNQAIDDIYEGALQHGALGGKLLGAGGGGFFMFYVPPFEKHNLLLYLEGIGLKVKPFRFEQNGLQTWTSRVNSNDKLFKVEH